MSNIEITFSANKALKRKDLIKLGEEITKQAAKKDMELFIIKISEDPKNPAANTIMFPFKIV